MAVAAKGKRISIKGSLNPLLGLGQLKERTLCLLRHFESIFDGVTHANSLCLLGRYMPNCKEEPPPYIK
jgi:hypothetical protein